MDARLITGRPSCLLPENALDSLKMTRERNAVESKHVRRSAHAGVSAAAEAQAINNNPIRPSSPDRI